MSGEQGHLGRRASEAVQNCGGRKRLASVGPVSTPDYTSSLKSDQIKKSRGFIRAGGHRGRSHAIATFRRFLTNPIKFCIKTSQDLAVHPKTAAASINVFLSQQKIFQARRHRSLCSQWRYKYSPPCSGSRFPCGGEA